MNAIIVHKFIWFWEVNKYRKSGHICVKDGSCLPFQWRADKYLIPDESYPGAITYIPKGYFLGEELQ